MKKKILVAILGLALCFGMTGCGYSGDIVPKNCKLSNKYFDLVTIYKDDDNDIEVDYDRNTKVMYFIKWTGYQFGITPIYNSDGTVRLYDGE